MMMIKVIAFDLDDTLWDLKPVIVRAEQRLGEWIATVVPHLDYSVDRLREHRHHLLQDEPGLAGKVTELRRRIIESALLEGKVPAAQAGQLSSEAMEVFLAARNEISLYEGVFEVLTELSRTYRLGALTNGNADIRRLGLDRVFSFAFSAEQVGEPKPGLALFQTAIAFANVQPEEMVYVGDDPVLDMDAAKRSGLRTVWVRTERKPDLGETRPDATIPHVRYLPDAIMQLNSAGLFAR